jgi:intracellular sulfur oxidation DsrE/DsrF family protein
MIRSTRRALAVATIGLAAVIAAVAVHSTPEASAASVQPEFQDTWLQNLNGKHRQLFDSPQPGGGIPLVHIMNYLNTYQRVYNVTDAQLNTVGTFYGATTFHALRDEMWTKYRIAEFLQGLGVEPGTGGSANPWRTSPQILGMTIPAASIEALQQRGTRFIVCNNALGIFASLLANARGLAADAVAADLKANVLPGVEIVPAMVIAIGQAQEAGIAYHRQ